MLKFQLKLDVPKNKIQLLESMIEKQNKEFDRYGQNLKLNLEK